jgi:phage host-nuclease inhibitor protein Gam
MKRKPILLALWVNAVLGPLEVLKAQRISTAEEPVRPIRRNSAVMWRKDKVSKTNRIKAVSEVRSRAEFDQLLEDIAIRQLTLERVALRRDQKILAIRADYDVDLKDMAQDQEAAVLRAEKYATAHRAELLPGKKKTSETGVAFFGFRTGNPTLVLLNRKWSWKAVLDMLRVRRRFDLIITKQEPAKDAMKASLDDAGRAEFGTRIKQDETFFIDPKRDPADPQRLAVATEDRRAA